MRNAAWLTGLQLISYVLPLLTAPVVTRAFGPALFGFVVTATAASSYVSLVMSFGFPWSGPRLVARTKSDPEKLSAEVSAIFTAQLVLGALASSVFVAWTLMIEEPPDLRLAQWSILASAIFTTLVPAWLFQGLERMPELVIPQILLRVLATAAVILLVDSRDDLVLYVSINASSAALGTVIFFILLKKANLGLRRPSLSRIWRRAEESTNVFLSNIAVSFYTIANVLLVSYLLGNEAAGIFGLADRVRGAVMGLLVPMTQAIYPFVCRTVNTDDPDEQLAKQQMFRIMIWTSVVLGILLFVTAPVAVSILGGAHFEDAVSLLRIFAIVPLLVTMSNILGVQIMLPHKMDRSVVAVVTTCAVLGVGSQVLLTRAFGLKGSAWAYVIVEGMVCCGFATALTIRRNRDGKLNRG